MEFGDWPVIYCEGGIKFDLFIYLFIISFNLQRLDYEMFKLAGDMDRHNQREINHGYNSVTDSVENRWARRRLCCNNLLMFSKDTQRKKFKVVQQEASVVGSFEHSWSRYLWSQKES